LIFIASFLYWAETANIHFPEPLSEAVVAHVFDRFFNRESPQGFTQIAQLFRLLQCNFFAGKTAIR